MNEIPPRSEELEQAILGAILQNPKRLVNGSISHFAPEIFYKAAHRTIAESMAALAGQGIAPDIANLVASMTETGNLQKVGGAYAITGLPELASIDPQGDLSRLQELAAKRQIREAAIKFADLAFEYHSLAEIQEQRDLLFHLPTEVLASKIGVIDKPMTAQEMASDQTPQPPDIITGILPLETIMLLFGDPGVGKTLLALALGMALAEGRSWHNFEITKSYRVLCVVAEGGYFSLRERVKILLGTSINLPEDKLFLWPVGPFHILDPSDFAEMSHTIEWYDPDVVIFDPMRKLHTADENDNGSMQTVMSKFRSLITNQRRSLILAHHTNKGPHTARGASAIIGDCDTVLKFELNRGDKSIATHLLRAEKVRHGAAPSDLALSLDSSTLKFITQNPLGRDRIYAIMRNKGGHIGSKKELVDQLTLMGEMKSSNAYALVKKAIEANIICLEADGSFSLSIPISSIPKDSKAQTGKK